MKATKKELQESLINISKEFKKINIFIDGMNHYIRSFSTTYGLEYSPKNQDISGFYYSIKFLALFMKMIEKIFNKHDIQTHIVIEHGKSQIMKDIINEYKSNRKYKQPITIEEEEKKEAFFDNLTLFINFLKLLNPFIKVYNLKNVEGDFVIAYLYYISRQHDTLNIIVSTDKDFYQLLKNDDIIIINPYLNKIITEDKLNNFTKTSNLTIENFEVYKILIGDKSDNIKGVTGTKTAEKVIKLLEEYSNEQITDISILMDITKEFIKENKKHYKILDKIVDNEKYLKKVNKVVNLSEMNVLDILDSSNISIIMSIFKNNKYINNYKKITQFLENLNIDTDLLFLINNFLIGDKK